jgi:hypothetical protein
MTRHYRNRASPNPPGWSEATSIVGVARDRLDAMVGEGLLTVQRGVEDEPKFLRAELEALGLLGG